MIWMRILKELIEKFEEWIKKWMGIMTLLSVSLAVLILYLTYKELEHAINEGETQRYNTAWLLVNSHDQSSPDGGGNKDQSSPDGGRKEALVYLKDHNQSLQGGDFSHAVLSYIRLDGMDLNRATMENADLFGADLRAASLWAGDMENANLQFSRLNGADLEYADLKCTDLRGAHLEELAVGDYLDKLKLTNSNIKYIRDKVRNEYVTTNLSWSLIPTNLKEADLSFAHLEGADLTGAKLVHAKLINAHLENYKDIFDPKNDPAKPPCTRYSRGLIGLDWWYPMASDPTPEQICGWTRAPEHIQEYRGQEYRIKLPTSFSCSEPPNTDSGGAKKPAAKLTGADLTGADLTGADLTGANLTEAIGITTKQIDVAHLCHTTLPSYIPNAREMRDRDCSKPAPASGGDGHEQPGG